MTKPTKWHVRQATTRIILCICQVWSVFAVCLKKAWVIIYLLSAQQRLRSAWAVAQADLSLRWAHMPFCWFYHALAHVGSPLDGLTEALLIRCLISSRKHILWVPHWGASNEYPQSISSWRNRKISTFFDEKIALSGSMSFEMRWSWVLSWCAGQSRITLYGYTPLSTASR